MAFKRRGPHATYSRVLDGEHVWWAVRGAESLFLRRKATKGAPGEDVELATEVVRDDEGVLLSVRFAVAEHYADDPAEEIELVLHARSGRTETPVAWRAPEAVGPALAAPITRDRRWHWRTEARRGRVVLTRAPAAPGVPATGVRRGDDGALLTLPAAHVGGADHAELVADGTVLARLPLETDGDDRRLVLTGAPGLPRGALAHVRVDGRPVVRWSNEIRRPHLAVALPPLPDPTLELRWLPWQPDGAALVVQHVDRTTEPGGEQP